MSLLSGMPAASGSRVPPGPDRSKPTFTHAEARQVLAKAQRQVRTDTRRVRAGKPVGNGIGTDITMTLRTLYLARPSLTGPEREKADSILARPSDNQDNNDDAVKWNTAGRANQDTDCTGPVCVHWVNQSGNKDYATDGYKNQVVSVMSNVWNTETGSMGYKTPMNDTSSGGVDNPDTKVDVYLADLNDAGLYGYCVPTLPQSGRHTSAYCVLDNDYDGYGIPRLSALQVTAAHEFFHAIQFNYDVGEDLWFMEATAAWIEDEVYDAINDNVQFLAFGPMRYPSAPVDLTTDYHRYGSWIFFKYASERLGRTIVRQMWQLADSGTSSRYSLQAIRSAVSGRISWTSFMATFAAWNTRQPHGYSEAARYPAPRWLKTATLSKKHKSTGWLSINLPHLSSGPLKVIPAAKLAPGKHLTVEANLPPAARGSALLVQRRFKNGVVSNSLLTLNSQGDGHARLGFNHNYLAYIALIPVNTSTSMVYCGMIAGYDGGPAYSCSGRGYYDYGQKYALRAKVS